MMKELGYFAAGDFLEEGPELKAFSPWDASLAGKTWLAGKEVLEACIQKAGEAAVVLRQAPLYQRAAWLQAIAEGIVQHQDEIARTIAAESGKPIRYALGETARAAQTFRIAAGEVLRQPGEYLPIDWAAGGEGKEAWVKWFPSGIVAGISPFNFPLNLVAHKIAPALAAGCPIILKPSSSTPLSALLLARVIQASGLPPGCVSILPMRREDAETLVTDPRFAVLSFTGSPQVGWAMKARAGRKKVILELGGNAGVIIAASADIETAARKCVSGGFAYSGQVCIHTQRIFVQESIFEEFSEHFTDLSQALKYGDPMDPGTEISSMIDEENALRVEEWIGEAVEGGARLLCGGRRKGTFVEPTVLTGTQAEMKVCALEVFGPVVTMEPYIEFEDAVRAVNQGRFGLQAGVFTESIGEMDYAFNHLEVGGVILNDVPTFRADHMPYGGVKESGLGREGVRYAMREMMEARILVKPKGE